MNSVQRIGKNLIALSTSYFSVAILSMLLSIFIARLLGDVALGKYFIASYIPPLFLVLLDLGFETYIIREVARKKDQASKYLSNAFTFRLLLIPIIISMILVAVNLLGYPENTKYIVYLFSIYYIFSSLSSLIKMTFRAFEKMGYEAIITIFISILRISLCLLFLYLGYGLLTLALIFIFSGILEFIITLLVCRKKFVKIKLEIDISFMKKAIKIALPFAVVTLFGAIFVRIDTIMLSYMKGDAVVGWYNAAYSLTLGLNPVPLLIMNAILPLLSYSYISSKESLKMAYDKSFKYLFYLGLPLAIGTFMLADGIIFLVYGAEFVNSIVALKILAWDILIKFLYLCSSYILIATDKQKQMTMFVIATALLNIILNLFLIPSYSYIGSGIATLISEFFLLVIYLYINVRDSLAPNIKKFLFQPIIASSVMAYFLWQFPEIQLVLKILIAIFIYFTLLIVLKGISREDFQIIRQLIKKEKD
jgi:O-antigen/teichoic acid export membrane protein